jgi:hypothetical protein
MGFIRKAGARKKSSPKRLYVHPSELAEKLIKEMEDNKTWGSDRVWVGDRYTVYLCLEDYERFRGKEAKIRSGLIDRLYEHVEDMGYELTADIDVEIVLDRDLELGRFGILAHPVKRGPAEARPAGQAQPGAAERPEAGRVPAAPAKAAAAAGAATFTPPVAATGSAVAAGAAAASTGPGAGEVPASAGAGGLDSTRAIIVLRSGEQMREFAQDRVVIGRARDVDFRVDHPSVSRRHAAVFWADGRLVVEDLGSTNGTMVNGYPVTKTVLGPRDVIVIGERRITAELK